MQKITPFLWFDRQAEEAMNLYVDIFKGSPFSKNTSRIVEIQRYPESGLEGPMKGFEGQVLTGVFELEGQKFMALDGGSLFKFSEAFSFLVDCSNQEEIDYFWNRLIADGGQESQCGWLKDRFGFSWQIVPDMAKFFNSTDPEKSGRAMHAMLQMKKIDIAALERAYGGQ